MTQNALIGTTVWARQPRPSFRTSKSSRSSQSSPSSPRQATILNMATQANTRYYYVHWVGQANRYDSWIKEEFISLSPSSETTIAALTVAAGDESSPQHQESTSRLTQSSREGSPHSISASKLISPRQSSTKLQRKRQSKFFSKPKNILNFVIPPHTIPAWYFSPFRGTQPCDEFIFVSELYLCPHCLYYTREPISLDYHMSTCEGRPPGHCIYSTPTATLFETDGALFPTFCHRLALLSKAFIEHKTIDYDMTTFVFYTLCIPSTSSDISTGCITGYFSREKESTKDWNLSCILTLPPFHGLGIGSFLVSVSYEMSRRRGVPGAPEKPLSDLGLRLYSAWWRKRLTRLLHPLLRNPKGSCTVRDLVNLTGISAQDVVTTLKALEILKDTTSASVMSPDGWTPAGAANTRRSSLLSSNQSSSTLEKLVVSHGDVVTSRISSFPLELNPLRTPARNVLRFSAARLQWDPKEYLLNEYTAEQLRKLRADNIVLKRPRDFIKF